jgi:hypothetical protein
LILSRKKTETKKQYVVIGNETFVNRGKPLAVANDFIILMTIIKNIVKKNLCNGFEKQK